MHVVTRVFVSHTDELPEGEPEEEGDEFFDCVSDEEEQESSDDTLRE